MRLQLDNCFLETCWRAGRWVCIGAEVGTFLLQISINMYFYLFFWLCIARTQCQAVVWEGVLGRHKGLPKKKKPFFFNLQASCQICSHKESKQCFYCRQAGDGVKAGLWRRKAIQESNTQRPGPGIRHSWSRLIMFRRNNHYFLNIFLHSQHFFLYLTAPSRGLYEHALPHSYVSFLMQLLTHAALDNADLFTLFNISIMFIQPV